MHFFPYFDKFESVHGDFTAYVFSDGKDQAVVVTKGDIKDNVLCRIQSECISSHVFFGKTCDCREQMAGSLQLIADEGSGIAIYLHGEGRGNGAAAHIATLDLRFKYGHSQSDAYIERGFAADARDFGISAKVLEYFGVKSVRLITLNKDKIDALEKWNIDITTVYYSGKVIFLGETANNVAAAVKDGSAQSPIPMPNESRRVLVLGDLNVDYLMNYLEIKGGVITNKPKPKIGGTGINAAQAFYEEDLVPILFGKVGNDQEGRLIIQDLRGRDFYSLLGSHPTMPTGSCQITFFPDNHRWLMQDTEKPFEKSVNQDHLWLNV